MMEEENAKEAAEKIIEEIDKSTLLGAAYDCMSDNGKTKFQKKIESILKDAA